MSQRGFCYGRSMIAALRTGFVYFALVFGLAFAFGAVRTLALEPRIGGAAVLIEVPIIVGASWAVARRLLRRRNFSLPQRTVVGATAFALTMMAEMLLAWVLRGQDVAAWAGAVATPLGLVGLVGQIGFAVMPLFVGRSASSGAGRLSGAPCR